MIVRSVHRPNSSQLGAEQRRWVWVPGCARSGQRPQQDGNSLTREPAKREPGATLELLFRQNPDLKPGPFLAYVEQKYRLLGDLEMLREIRAYRAKHGL